MRALLLVTLMSLTCSVAVAGTVYKWVDENGVVHYSDQPHENAEKVELKAPQTYSSPNTSGSQSYRAPGRGSGPPPASAYQSCTVSEPTNDQVYMNTDTVNAGVTIQPTVR